MQCSNKFCSLSYHKAKSNIEAQFTTVTVNFTVTAVTSKVTTNISYINVLTIPIMLSYHKAKLEVQLSQLSISCQTGKSSLIVRAKTSIS